MARGEGRELYPLVAGALPAAAGLVVVGANLIGRPVLFAAVMVGQLSLAVAWVHVAHLVEEAAPLLVIAAATVAIDFVAVPRGGIELPGVAAILAVAVVGAVVVGIAAPDRRRVTESLATTLSAVVLAIFGAHMLALSRGYGGRHVLLLALLAAAAALLAGRALDQVVEEPRYMRSSGRGW
ncbi:MAG: hypothetical protein ABR520_10235, partial [Mycobacteriales bacterium]|nr:hypothetical protein [Frankia sp.]MCA1833604.1 hypothetical protein [Actinomycetota bacterium]